MPCGFFIYLGNRFFSFPQGSNMTGNKLIDYFEDIDDIEEAQTQAPMGTRTSKMRQTKKQEKEARMFIRAQGIADKFNFTFRAARTLAPHCVRCSAGECRCDGTEPRTSFQLACLPCHFPVIIISWFRLFTPLGEE
jgi:hypothetical protein